MNFYVLLEKFEIHVLSKNNYNNKNVLHNKTQGFNLNGLLPFKTYLSNNKGVAKTFKFGAITVQLYVCKFIIH